MTSPVENGTLETIPEKLNKTTLKKHWSKTYNTEGKPDWSHIFPYYHDNIVFQDSIQKLEGIENFKAMCQRLTDRCTTLNMDIISVAQEENVIHFEWIMTMSFKKYPSTPLYGASKLVLNDEGIIISQRDYYDLWGDIFNNIPRFGKAYRRFLERKFG